MSDETRERDIYLARAMGWRYVPPGPETAEMCGVGACQGFRCLPPAPPGTGHAGWRADTVLETTPAPALRNQALMPVWLTPA